MKSRIVLTLLLAGLLAAACAQQDSSSPTSGTVTASSLNPSAEGSGRIFEKLGLTGEQKTAVKAVFEAHRTEREAIRQARQNGASADELKAQHEALKAKIHEELKAVLTEAQVQQLEEWHKNREAHQHGPLTDAERTAWLNKHMERLTESLGLTPEQQEKLRALWTAGFSERVQLPQSAQPSAEERKARHEARMEQMRQILTAEQFTKLQEMRPMERGAGGHPDNQAG